MSLLNIDLRTVVTGVRLTETERVEAEIRHLVARNEAELRRAKAYNAKRGLTPMAIGTQYLPPHVARHYQHSDSVGGTK